MDLRGYLKVLQRRWISILVITLATLAVTAGITFALTPQYTASTRLFFGVQGAQSGSDLAQGSTFAEAQLTSYAQVATSPLVLAPVIQNLGLQLTPVAARGKVSAFAPTDTVIIQVTVTDSNAARAAAIANAVGQQLASVTSDLSPRRQDGSQSVKATILAPAQVPTDAVLAEHPAQPRRRPDPRPAARHRRRHRAPAARHQGAQRGRPRAGHRGRRCWASCPSTPTPRPTRSSSATTR